MQNVAQASQNMALRYKYKNININFYYLENNYSNRTLGSAKV